jgi:NAD(P)-dependent dehydrogenase (short-subunit alcohol dehydrogenase family)
VTEALARGAAQVFALTRAPMNRPDARVVNVLVDLTDTATLRMTLGGIPRLDLVVNNAGLAMLDDVSDPAVLQQHLDVNVFGPQAVIAATRTALEATKGSVVNVLSIAALAPAPIIPSYSISKAAALSLTLALRGQLAPSGVDVYAALPGPMDTEMSRDLDALKASPADVAAAIFDGVAAGTQEIFPDPMSQMFSGGWEDGPTKVFERAQSDFAVAEPAAGL